MHSSFENNTGSRFHRLAALSGVVAVCAACAAPRRAPLDDEQIAASVRGRATSVAEFETALALADLGPFAVPRPSSPASLDPADPEFWHACAYLYEPSVRQARRGLEARRALARGAGALPSIGASAEHVRSGDDRETEAMATFDLLALLGVGPSAAAKGLARAEVCEALAGLESAVWAARFRVDRARVRLGAAFLREAAAAEIVREASEDQPRISILERAGRGSPAEIAWARATTHAAEQAASQARADQALARAELSMATGLPPEHPALLSAPDEKREIGRVLVTDARALLSTVPKLRALKLKYAVAEARLRSAVAATWPGLEIGPKVTLVPDDVLGGGIVSLRMPLPGATRPVIAAAMIERTAARDALEDELIAVLARNHALSRQLSELTDNTLRHVDARRQGALEMWKASRARFRADESALNTWNLSLETLIDAASAAISTREAIDILLLDIQESSGPGHAPRPESRAP